MAGHRESVHGVTVEHQGKGRPKAAPLEVAHVWHHVCSEKTRFGLPGIVSVREPG